ncbi:GNAT family N-acetyltransferase [Tianweitania sp. BSSL-BM11]|uniref:GNAT family N-acetyltransferase n=1 Tax=Tianweitania aestuarii TaxID=2814886 RepID=A0ABS5RWV0_9HYPH|nr:GNAT family N-acetyltransferase [Tianweitania aestuarii]MBS9721509.1 GNAT family N-acetyltransferase [Tianweitania aestuarii]
MVVEKEDLEDRSAFAINCPVLVTERLVLRPPHDDDVLDLVQYANNRQLASMLSSMPHPYGEREARAFITRCNNNATAGIGYALTLADNGAFIGCASLIEGSEGLALGYWIGLPHQGEGFATEAAHALVDLAFRATEINRLYASCRVVNTASRRVIQKCGFHYAGPGMAQSRTVGQVPVERYQLDRKTWISLRSWPRNN